MIPQSAFDRILSVQVIIANKLVSITNYIFSLLSCPPNAYKKCIHNNKERNMTNTDLFE